jgi:hypothetical protein
MTGMFSLISLAIYLAMSVSLCKTIYIIIARPEYSCNVVLSTLRRPPQWNNREIGTFVSYQYAILRDDYID